MDSLFLWEMGTPKVSLIWLLVLAAQIVVAEINRRWNWTIFAVWTVGGIALMPYAWIHGTPMVGWFPFGKYAIMILTATMTGTVLVYANATPSKRTSTRSGWAWPCGSAWPSTSWRPTSAT